MVKTAHWFSSTARYISRTALQAAKGFPSPHQSPLSGSIDCTTMMQTRIRYKCEGKPYKGFLSRDLYLRYDLPPFRPLLHRLLV